MNVIQQTANKVRVFFTRKPVKRGPAKVIPISVAPSATVEHRMGAIGNQTGSVKGSCGYLPGIDS